MRKSSKVDSDLAGVASEYMMDLRLSSSSLQTWLNAKDKTKHNQGQYLDARLDTDTVELLTAERLPSELLGGLNERCKTNESKATIQPSRVERGTGKKEIKPGLVRLID
jgi:hypothetical protein